MFKEFEQKINNQITSTIKKYIEDSESKIKKDVQQQVEKTKEDFNQTINYMEHQFNKQLADIREHAIQNEQYSRKSSVRVFGIKEEKDEDIGDVVTTFFKDIDIVNRVGKTTHDKRKSCAVIVKFLSHKSKEAVMRKKYLLKDTE